MHKIFSSKYRRSYISAILALGMLFVTGIYNMAQAAAPVRSIGFQGQLFNSGTAVDSSVSATFTFYDAVTGGSVEGSPINKTISVSDGYFATSFSESDISGIDFNQSLWIEVVIEGNTLSPRSQINSVPFAHKGFGVFSYAAEPTAGPSGSLYFNSVTGQLMVSNGSTWATVATSTGSSATTTLSVGNGFLYTATSTDGLKASYFVATSSTATSTFAGALGIGTSTPGAKVDVWGNLRVGTSSTPTFFVNTAISKVGINITPLDGYDLSVNGLAYAGGFAIAGNGAFSSLSSGANITMATGGGGSGNITIDTVSSNGVNKNIILLPGGNVGIGTTSPSTTLFIQGSGGTNPFAVASSTGTQMLTLTQAGYLGLGTTTPTSPLTIVPTDISGVQEGLRLSDNGSGSGEGLRIIWNSASRTNMAGIHAVGSASNGGNLLFSTNSANSGSFTTRMTIDQSGNIGIGTTSPSAKLAVTGTAGSSESIFVVASSSETRLFSVSATGAAMVADTITWSSNNNTLSSNGIVFPGSNAASIVVNNSSASSAFSIGCGGNAASNCTFKSTTGSGTTDHHKFQVGNNGAIEALRIISNGNIGIGTSTPDQTLTVVGGMRLTGAFFDTNNASGTAGMVLQTTGTGTQWVATSSLGISGGSGNSAFTIGSGLIYNATSTDLVGIGTTSPSTTLFIQGKGGTNPFAVASSTGTQMLTLTQAGNLGIGTTSPKGQLHIFESATPRTAFTYADNLVIETDGDNGMTFLTNNADSSYINFADNASSNAGQIEYNHNNNFFSFRVNNSGYFNIYDGYAEVRPHATTDGQFYIYGGSSDNDAILHLQSDGGALGTDRWAITADFTNKDLNFTNDSNSRLYITDDGNIGIGTTSPSTTLFVQGRSGTNPFVIASSTGTQMLILTQGGYLGIGTTSPVAKFSVFGDSYFDGSLTFASSTATTTILGGLNVGNGALMYDWSSGITSIDSVELGALNFAADGGVLSWADMEVTTSAATSTVESYSAQIDGNAILTIYAESDGSGGIQNPRVGLGTTTPTARFVIAGHASNTDQLFVIATSSGAQYLNFTNTGYMGLGSSTPNAKLVISGSAGSLADLFVVSSSTNAHFLTIKSSGNVGIGTSTPTVSLAVIGNAQFTGVTSGTYASDLNLTAEGFLTTSASDERLKENLVELPATTLKKLLSLKTYNFSWINDTTHRTDIGLIAQQVETVFPELVFTNNTDGYKGLNYSRLSTLLLRGIQEQQVHIEELQKYAIFIRTKELHTEKLCVGTEDEEVCVTKDEFKKMIQNAGIYNSSDTGHVVDQTLDTNLAPITDPIDTDSGDYSADNGDAEIPTPASDDHDSASVSEPEPTTEPEPSPLSAPVPVPVSEPVQESVPAPAPVDPVQSAPQEVAE